jgi:hypothetical protein
MLFLTNLMELQYGPLFHIFSIIAVDLRAVHMLAFDCGRHDADKQQRVN